jgi:hypothetical protein
MNAGHEELRVYGGKHTGSHAYHDRAGANIIKTFFSKFDESPESGIYCKAPLNTAATHREAQEDSGDAAKAARIDQIKNLIFLTSFQKLMYTTRLS